MSDWSSDVCSSDLSVPGDVGQVAWDEREHAGRQEGDGAGREGRQQPDVRDLQPRRLQPLSSLASRSHCFARALLMTCCNVLDRKSVVSGKSGSVRVDLGGRRIVKKKTNTVTTDIK